MRPFSTSRALLCAILVAVAAGSPATSAAQEPAAPDKAADGAAPDTAHKPGVPHAHPDAGAAVDAGETPDATSGAGDAGDADAAAAPADAVIPKFLTENAIIIGDAELFPDLSLKFTPLDEKLRLAIERFREEATEEAIKLAADYLTERPNAPFEAEARFVLGLALLFTGDSFTAEKILRKGDAPRYIEDYRQYYLAESVFKNGDHAEALKLFQEVPLKFPGSSLSRPAEMRAADALHAAGNAKEAYSAYKAFIYGARPHERLDTIYFNMARCALENGDLEPAARYALKIWYKYPESYLAGQALEILTAVRRQNPKLGGSTYKQRYSRAVKLSKSRFHDKAIAEMTALYDAIPDTKANRPMLEKVYFKLGQLFGLEKENDLAREVYVNIRENGIFGSEAKAKALFELANIEKRVENNRKAIELYLEFVEKHKKHVDADNALYFAAWLRYSMKEYDEARTLFERQIREYPRSDVRDESLWFLAWTHFKNNQVKRAMGLLRTAVRDVPESQSAPRAAYFAAKFALRLKQDEDARAGFEKVIADYPLTYYSFLAQHWLKELWDIDREMPDANPGWQPSEPGAQADGGDADASVSSDDGQKAQSSAAVPQRGAKLKAESPSNGGAALMDRFTAISRDTLSVNKSAALMRLGLPEAAANELARLKENAGNDPDGHYAAATLYALTGDYYRAIVTLRSIFLAQMLRRYRVADKKYWRRMFPLAYRSHVEAAAAAHRLDPLLVLAIMREESNFRPKVVSPVGARGLMQIMPKTGKLIASRNKVEDFDTEDLFTPQVNITFGSWYLRELLVKFNGQVPMSISGYNAGPGAVERWLRNKGTLDLDEFIEEIPYKETRNYCKRVLQTYGIYRHLYTSTRTPLPLFTRPNQQFNDNVDF